MVCCIVPAVVEFGGLSVLSRVRKGRGLWGVGAGCPL